MVPTTTKNDDGHLDGIYSYLYGHYPQRFYARVAGNALTVGHSSPEEASGARLVLRLTDHDVTKIESGAKWQKVAHE